MKAFAPVSSLRMATAAAALSFFAAAPAFADGKYAAIVVDMDSGKVLHERDAEEPRYPASLTKVMTLYLAFDALDSGKLKLTDKMTVTRHAQHQAPSRLGLKAGQSITVEDAIRAMVTKSANDVAVVVAEKLGGGSEEKFAAKMNAKAKELGLQHTHFENASGLPSREQLTTAHDLEKLAVAMFYDHRDRYNYFSTPEFTWKRRHYDNHNNLLGKVEGVDGIKTGYTNASGYNLMASAERNGHRVIAVMLGGTTGKSRDQHVADLLEAAFLSINAGSAMASVEPPVDAPATTRVALKGVGVKPKNGADALALQQLQRFSAIDAAEVSASPEAVAKGKHADDSTEEGDDDSPAEGAGGDDDAAPAAKAHATAVAAAPVVTQASPAAAAAIAPATAPQPTPKAAAVAPARPVAPPVVDSPLVAPTPAAGR